MVKKIDLNAQKNEKLTTPADFIEMYNKGLPPRFPRATLEDLEIFRAQHARLFNEKGEWSIDKFRKRFMDWLSSYRRKQ